MSRKPIASRSARVQRRGATVVEMAVVLPVFGIFMAGIMEFGHTFLVVATLNGAAKQAARYGAVEGVTTEDVLGRAERILGSSLDASKATFYVKDASVFDEQDMSGDSVNYAGLPDIELASAELTQLYLVRIEVPYDEVALLPPFWAKSLTLVGQSVMRHE